MSKQKQKKNYLDFDLALHCKGYFLLHVTKRKLNMGWMLPWYLLPLVDDGQPQWCLQFLSSRIFKKYDPLPDSWFTHFQESPNWPINVSHGLASIVLCFNLHPLDPLHFISIWHPPISLHPLCFASIWHPPIFLHGFNLVSTWSIALHFNLASIYLLASMVPCFNLASTYLPAFIVLGFNLSIVLQFNLASTYLLPSIAFCFNFQWHPSISLHFNLAST